jgi:oligopeptidase B
MADSDHQGDPLLATEIDEYGWMADKTKSDPDILAYLKAENDYADGLMRATAESQGESLP